MTIRRLLAPVLGATALCLSVLPASAVLPPKEKNPYELLISRIPPLGDEARQYLIEWSAPEGSGGELQVVAAMGDFRQTQANFKDDKETRQVDIDMRAGIEVYEATFRTLGAPYIPITLALENCTSGKCVPYGKPMKADEEAIIVVTHPAPGRWRATVGPVTTDKPTEKLVFYDNQFDSRIGKVSVAPEKVRSCAMRQSARCGRAIVTVHPPAGIKGQDVGPILAVELHRVEAGQKAVFGGPTMVNHFYGHILWGLAGPQDLWKVGK